MDEHSGRCVFEGLKTATLLRPGDRVLLTVAPHWTREMVDQVLDFLKERFPDIDFTLVSDVYGVTVLTGGTE